MSKINHMSIMVTNVVFTMLRMVLGWVFLYEALWRLSVPCGFSFAGRFRLAPWLGADVFRAIAQSSAAGFVDGLLDALTIFAGAALLLGLLRRSAVIAGGIYCLIAYVIAPPFLAPTGESHFLVVNRAFISAVVLVVAWLAPGYGLRDGLTSLKRLQLRRLVSQRGERSPEPGWFTRRKMILGFSSVPALLALGGAGVFSAAKQRKDAVCFTGPNVPPISSDDLKGLSHPIDQTGVIKGLNGSSVEMSRLILGGNVIGGWAHTRDMNFYNKMVKAYHTDERVFRTFRMAEECGIKAILTNPALMRVITRYWTETGGKLGFLSDCGHPKGLVEGARASVKNGASLVYTHGGIADNWAAKGNWQGFREFLDEARKLGVPVGIGGHKIATVKFCVEHDLIPDFWMKTVHRIDYPTADFGDGEKGVHHDNNFCVDGAEATFEYMKSRPEPWIAFKINAAGAYHPRESLPMAFKGGADFVCLGMYDYQIVEDVNIFNDVFKDGLPKRERSWRA